MAGTPNSSATPGLQNLSANQILRLLATSKGANMGATGDTPLQLIDTAKYSVSAVLVTNASASLAQAAGALYTAAANTGTQIVANAALSGASASTKVVSMTVANTDVQSVQNLYFRIITATTAAASADVYVYGYCFD